MSQGIIRVFLNVDMRNGHDGLATLAKEHQLKVSEIERGSFIVFVNAQKNKVKLYAANDTIAYLRMPRGSAFNLNVVRELPKVFNGRNINYTEGLKLAVEKQLIAKGSSIRVI